LLGDTDTIESPTSLDGLSARRKLWDRYFLCHSQILVAVFIHLSLTKIGSAAETLDSLEPEEFPFDLRFRPGYSSSLSDFSFGSGCWEEGIPAFEIPNCSFVIYRRMETENACQTSGVAGFGSDISVTGTGEASSPMMELNPARKFTMQFESHQSACFKTADCWQLRFNHIHASSICVSSTDLQRPTSRTGDMIP